MSADENLVTIIASPDSRETGANENLVTVINLSEPKVQETAAILRPLMFISLTGDNLLPAHEGFKDPFGEFAEKNGWPSAAAEIVADEEAPFLPERWQSAPAAQMNEIPRIPFNPKETLAPPRSLSAIPIPIPAL